MDTDTDRKKSPTTYILFTEGHFLLTQVNYMAIVLFVLMIKLLTQRDLDTILDAFEQKKTFFLYTG